MDRLATDGLTLGMPHNRYLADKLWELRFRCGQVNQRITYTAEPDRQLITLTTFRKQRHNERDEVIRARKALRRHRNRKG
ncbi:type II toxin-antitoxin system RelE/ParE family toxin [Mycolicibacterium madagascariense]|nr:type II toxin-antitoxin system RelE/ParE family toxin [Mycolicibacterium madagascariense]